MTGPTLDRFSGGIQTHIKNFLSAFETDRNIKIKFFATTKGLYDKEFFFLKIIRLIYLIIPFCKETRKNDIIHLNCTLDSRSLIRDSILLCIAKIMRNKVVIQFHGGLATEMRLFKIGWFKDLFGNILKLSDSVLLLSRRQQEDFANIFTNIKSVVLPNFIDVNGRPEKKIKRFPVFLFLSRVDEEKGIKEIVEAAEVLAEKGFDFKINICGDGPLRDWLRQSIFSRNLVDWINYMGVVTGPDKYKILIESDVMLLPTRHREGFPYVILEAFRYSMPVISCPVGAISEIVKNGWNGFLIDGTGSKKLADTMEYFCKNPLEISIMGKRARLLVEKKYSIDIMKDSFFKIYSGI